MNRMGGKSISLQDSLGVACLVDAARLLEIMQMLLELPLESPEPISIFGPEEWRSIEWAPGDEVSSLGRFRNCLMGTILKGTVVGNGYQHIGLQSGGTQVWKLAHRVVAQAFLPNPKNLPIVNHRNAVRTDNRVSNLEWVSRRGNALHWVRRKQGWA